MIVVSGVNYSFLRISLISLTGKWCRKDEQHRRQGRQKQDRSGRKGPGLLCIGRRHGDPPPWQRHILRSERRRIDDMESHPGAAYYRGDICRTPDGYCRLSSLLSRSEMSLLLAGPERSPGGAEQRACQQVVVEGKAITIAAGLRPRCFSPSSTRTTRTPPSDVSTSISSPSRSKPSIRFNVRNR